MYAEPTVAEDGTVYVCRKVASVPTVAVATTLLVLEEAWMKVNVTP
jgi:hypothetical protein